LLLTEKSFNLQLLQVYKPPHTHKRKHTHSKQRERERAHTHKRGNTHTKHTHTHTHTLREELSLVPCRKRLLDNGLGLIIELWPHIIRCDVGILPYVALSFVMDATHTSS